MGSTLNPGAITTSPNSAPDINTFDPSIYSNPYAQSSSSGMNPSVASGLANSGGGIISSIINNIWEDARAKKQREWNEEMMDKQNQWSLDMWNRTNAYNSPAAQKGRMTEAGLNSAFYGLDGSSANGLESAQVLGYQRGQTDGIPNPVSSYIDAMYKRAQLDNVNADTAQKSQQTLSEVERQQNLRKERDEMDARIQDYKSKAKLNDKSSEYLDKQLNRYNEYIDSVIHRNEASSYLDDSQRKRIEELLPGEKELQSMSIQDFTHKWSYWNAQIEHLGKQDALLTKQCKYYLISLLTNGVYGSGLSAINGLILNEIKNDPDLTDKEKEQVSKPFEQKPKNDFVPTNYSNRDYSRLKDGRWEHSSTLDSAMNILGYDNR